MFRTILQFKHFKAKRGTKGQMFPFLTIIIVIILIAVVAFVNVSQVNTQKIYTMNSADAAALAGAALLASTANNIASSNAGSGSESLMNTYLYAMGFFAIPCPLWDFFVEGRFYSYMGMGPVNLLRFIYLVSAGMAGVQGAAGQAAMTAFGNMPIEEAQTRIGSPTGDTKVPSEFSNWLHNINFYDSDRSPSYTYNWHSYYYNITEDKQMLRQQPDYVRVKIKKPDENCLVLTPAPAAPVVANYWMLIAPYLVVDEGAACWTDYMNRVLPKLIRMQGPHKVQAQTEMLIILGLAEFTDLLSQLSVTNFAGFLATEIAFAESLPALMHVFVIGGCPPGGFVWVSALYWFPVPFILRIENNSPEISVEVTRFSPTRDLGLWQFRERKVTSGAKAKIIGGSAMSDNYNIQLTEVWDGERL